MDNIDKIIEVINSKIYIYLKKSSNMDEAFEIFKQINTGGKPLTKDEIIATTLNQYAKKYETPIGMIEKKKIINKLVVSYYKYTRSDSRTDLDNIAIMGFINDKIVASKTDFILFSNYINTVGILNNSAIFNVVNYLGRSQLVDIIYILAIKGINVEIKREYLNKVILPLCLLSIVMTIKGINPGGPILTLYSLIINKIKNGALVDDIQMTIINFISENVFTYTISLQELIEGLGNGSKLSLNAKKAILIMDVIICNTSASVHVENINLEHVYPQVPIDAWAVKGWPANNEERKIIINSIGNYILLYEEINKKIKNKYIDEKRVEYEKIIPKDMALRTAMNTMDFDEFKEKKGAYVAKRQEAIAKKMKAEFPLGEVLIKS